MFIDKIYQQCYNENKLYKGGNIHEIKETVLCLFAITLIFIIGGCSNKTKEEEIQADNNNYSKYIGTYSITDDEGTKYESIQTLTIKALDGKTLDFEYELQPPRHTVTITTEQGVFLTDTTAEATGTYNIDGQVMPYGFEFRFNDNSIDFKCGFSDELNEAEYVTFSLNSDDDADENTSNKSEDEDKQPSTIINTSTGTDNPYTEPHKKGTGRQFTMTIEEFIEKYNEKINKRDANRLPSETEEALNEFFNDGKEHGWFSYPLDLGEATVDSSAVMEGEKATSYIFSGASKLDGITGGIQIYCYKDTGKICDVYCVVPKEWSLKGNARQIPRTQTPKTGEDYVSIPSDFQSFAGDVFSVINPEADGYDFFSKIFKEVGADNRNYKDGVYYAFRTTDESIKLQMAAVDWSFFENK